jgi:hypothetical protein
LKGPLFAKLISTNLGVLQLNKSAHTHIYCSVLDLEPFLVQLQAVNGIARIGDPQTGPGFLSQTSLGQRPREFGLALHCVSLSKAPHLVGFESVLAESFGKLCDLFRDDGRYLVSQALASNLPGVYRYLCLNKIREVHIRYFYVLEKGLPLPIRRLEYACDMQARGDFPAAIQILR